MDTGEKKGKKQSENKCEVETIGLVPGYVKPEET